MWGDYNRFHVYSVNGQPKKDKLKLGLDKKKKTVFFFFYFLGGLPQFHSEGGPS
jgi:hypothetical protein